MTPYMIDIIAKCFHEWLMWHYMTTVFRDIGAMIIIAAIIYMVAQFLKKMKF